MTRGVREVGTGESVEAGEEIRITHQVGVEIVSHSVADNTGGPGAFLLCVFEQIEVPSTESCLVVRVAMN